MNNEKTYSNSIIEDKIFELYGSAYMFFDWSIKYKNLYEELKPKNTFEKQSFITNDLSKYLILNSNLYLFYSINLIATLLSHKKDDTNKKELSLFEHVELLDNEIKIKANSDLMKLHELYKESGLEIIRNKIIAHKDIKTSGDPFTHFFNFINSVFYEKTNEILSKIKDYLKNYSLDGTSNNYTKEYYDKSHDIILDMIKNNFAKSK